MTERTIQRVAVIGAGKMGTGIAAEFARFGYRVSLHSRHEETLAHSMHGIRVYLDLMVETEIVPASAVDETLARIQITTRIEDAVEGIDYVVESAPEDLALKQGLFARLDELCPADVILATNSSTLRAEDCSAKAKRQPARILITHYWHPAPFIPLVEVIGGKRTDPAVLHTAARLLRGMHKRVVLQPLELASGPAGWGNALQQPMEGIARKLVEENGCDPRTVDDLIRFGFGRRLPLAAIFLRYDMTGLDFFYNAARARGSEPWGPFKQRVERGDIGMGSGKGFYDWPDKSGEEFVRRFNLGLIHMMKEDMARGEI